MVELTPRVIGFIALAVVLACVVQYWVVPPMALDKAADHTSPTVDDAAAAAERAKYNYYGVPDGEFDWCEPNFEFSHLVAEPINTVSGALFFLPALAGFRHHRARDLSRATKLNLVFITWIGVGTILFHATLRYTAQLLDELPILYVMVSGNYMLLARSRRGGIPWLGWALAGWALAITTAILASPQDSQFHNTARGVMSATFGVMFVHVFAGVASTLISLRKRAEKQVEAEAAAGKGANQKDNATDVDVAAAVVDAVRSGQELFQQTFFFILAGLVCWIVDNAFCDHLQPEGMLELPLYIQTHAVWHIFSAMGLYQMVLVLEFVCVAALAAAEAPNGAFRPGLRVERKGTLGVAVLNFSGAAKQD